MKECLLIFIFLFLSFFFSGAETALFSLTPVKLEKFKRRERKALKIEALKEKPDYLLSTILLGNMVVNIGFSSFLAWIFIKTFPSYGELLAILVATIVILIFGEMLPKGIAIYAPEKFSLLAVLPLRIFYRIFWPFCWLFLSISKIFLPASLRREVSQDVLNEEELKQALELGRSSGAIAKEEKDMIHSVLEFTEKEAKEIMTPRTEVKVLNIEMPSSQIETFLREVKHSCLPVYRGSIDEICGVLRTKEYFLNKDKQDINSLIREAFFIPESKKIDELLRELIERKEKFAVIIDEYGGFSGIVTLEDIQEEIFGEVYDEYEVPQDKIIKLKDKEFLVSADVSIKDLNYELRLDLPEEETSLGGFILELLGRFPKEKERIFYKGLEFVVEKATKKRLHSLRIIKK